MRKIQYSIKLLVENLNKNIKELEFWNTQLSSEDQLVIRQAKGNIGGCEERIKDITEALTQLGWTPENK